MDTKNEGKSGRTRKRGGRGRKGKQMSSSGVPETRSTSDRKDNPTGPEINDTSGIKEKAGNKQGPIRQIDGKLKPTSPVGNSQIDNKTTLKNRKKTSQLLSRESSAQKPSHSTTGNSQKTAPRTVPDGLNQSKSLENNSVPREEEKLLIHIKPHTSGTNSGKMDCRTIEKLLRQSKSPGRTQAQSDGSGADFQIINNPVRKKEANTSLHEKKESSGHMRPPNANRNNSKTDSGSWDDLHRQTKQTVNLQQQPFPCRSDELVSVIVEILVTNGGSIQISSLQKSLKPLYRDMLRLSSDNTFEGFIHDHRHVLRGSPDTGNIKVMSFFSDLDICREHGSSGGSCHNECRSLHICKFQMMNKCSRGKKCLFGHNLRSKYNWDVLIYHYMERLSNKQIREFLGSLDNRRGLTIPGICSYYNSKKGCAKPDKCPFLHICEHYIRDDCRYGMEKCCYSHDLLDAQPQCIIERYGLSGTKFSDLKRIIRKELEDADFSSCDEDSLSNVDYSDVQSNGRPDPNLCSSYSKIRHQWGRSAYSNGTEDTPSSSCDDKDSDADSNEYGEETDANSEKDTGIGGRFPTANLELYCQPACQDESLHESLQQAPKEEHDDYIMSAQISSSSDDRDIQPQVTRRLVSYDHCWRVSTGSDGKTTELTANDHQELDFLYQTYLRARQCTMSLSGQTMTINFETMTGSVKAGEDEENLVISRENC